jgi:hypothetical protein
MPERSSAANSRFADAKVHRRVVGRIDGSLRGGNDEGERSEGRLFAANFIRESQERYRLGYNLLIFNVECEPD